MLSVNSGGRLLVSGDKEVGSRLSVPFSIQERPGPDHQKRLSITTGEVYIIERRIAADEPEYVLACEPEVLPLRVLRVTGSMGRNNHIIEVLKGNV
jgi:hypothetical protein